MPTIIEAITELKNWAWEGAAYPLEDLARKIKTIEQVVLTKNIVSIPIESRFLLSLLSLLKALFLLI